MLEWHGFQARFCTRLYSAKNSAPNFKECTCTGMDHSETLTVNWQMCAVAMGHYKSIQRCPSTASNNETKKTTERQERRKEIQRLGSLSPVHKIQNAIDSQDPPPPPPPPSFLAHPDLPDTRRPCQVQTVHITTRMSKWHVTRKRHGATKNQKISYGGDLRPFVCMKFSYSCWPLRPLWLALNF